MASRRDFLKGLAGALAAPAIVQVANIMPVVARPELVLPPPFVAPGHSITDMGNGWFRVAAEFELPDTDYRASVMVKGEPEKVLLDLSDDRNLTIALNGQTAEMAQAELKYKDPHAMRGNFHKHSDNPATWSIKNGTAILGDPFKD